MLQYHALDAIFVDLRDDQGHGPGDNDIPDVHRGDGGASIRDISSGKDSGKGNGI